MITENCSQSLARDIFCHQLMNIEKAGHKIILHVHDEVIIECAESDAARTLEEVTQIMSTPPSWIPDIPLSAEGSITKIYTK
jgi:DNA polymerase